MQQLQESQRRELTAYDRLIAKIKTLPPEQQRVELARLQHDLEVERQEMRQQDAIEVQRELKNAIEDLSDEIGQSRY